MQRHGLIDLTNMDTGIVPSVCHIFLFQGIVTDSFLDSSLVAGGLEDDCLTTIFNLFANSMSCRSL